MVLNRRKRYALCLISSRGLFVLRFIFYVNCEEHDEMYLIGLMINNNNMCAETEGLKVDEVTSFVRTSICVRISTLEENS